MKTNPIQQLILKWNSCVTALIYIDQLIKEPTSITKKSATLIELLLKLDLYDKNNLQIN